MQKGNWKKPKSIMSSTLSNGQSKTCTTNKINTFNWNTDMYQKLIGHSYNLAAHNNNTVYANFKGSLTLALFIDCIHVLTEFLTWRADLEDKIMCIAALVLLNLILGVQWSACSISLSSIYREKDSEATSFLVSQTCKIQFSLLDS